MSRPTFTLCIPSYNRARHLPSLLDSIFSQDYTDFEVLICEDASPERSAIAAAVAPYLARHGQQIRYQENAVNLGYDANIRHLVAQARGEFCFFMGNDDILCPGALRAVAGGLQRHPDAGLILKAYAWFDGTPDQVNQTVRYFSEETEFPAGQDAISVAFRRSGVISGYIVHRDTAHAAATDLFDGGLYYQMHLTASVLASRSLVALPDVLVLCRNGEPPDFGNSAKEKGKFVPGRYTPEARLTMIGGVIRILEHLRDTRGIDVVQAVMRDYANYFFPYIRDQLDLPLRDYLKLYRGFRRLGFGRFLPFHFYMGFSYLVGADRFDAITRFIRSKLGRSPQFGIAGRSAARR